MAAAIISAMFATLGVTNFLSYAGSLGAIQNWAESKWGWGFFEPSELMDIRVVFKELTSQLWFSWDPNARKAFARYLLDAYPDGAYNPAKDRPLLESFAKAHHGRDGQ